MDKIKQLDAFTILAMGVMAGWSFMDGEAAAADHSYNSCNVRVFMHGDALEEV